MILGIAGASQSGKTTLAKMLEQVLSEKQYNVVTLHQDDFAQASMLIPHIKDHIDWEIPASIDFERFQMAIELHRHKCDILIVEGFLNFYAPPIFQYFDKAIFLDIDKATFLERKRKDLRWGKEPEWYFQHIWNCYLQYGQPPKSDQPILRLNSNEKIEESQLLHFLLTK